MGKRSIVQLGEFKNHPCGCNLPLEFWGEDTHALKKALCRLYCVMQRPKATQPAWIINARRIERRRCSEQSDWCSLHSCADRCADGCLLCPNRAIVGADDRPKSNVFDSGDRRIDRLPVVYSVVGLYTRGNCRRNDHPVYRLRNISTRLTFNETKQENTNLSKKFKLPKEWLKSLNSSLITCSNVGILHLDFLVPVSTMVHDSSKKFVAFCTRTIGWECFDRRSLYQTVIT